MLRFHSSDEPFPYFTRQTQMIGKSAPIQLVLLNSSIGREEECPAAEMEEVKGKPTVVLSQNQECPNLGK
jgi:hypothetical protein